MKIARLIFNHSLFLATVFLLVFIPLYPKLPIINVQHTWVYVRLEDFAVAIVLAFWFFLFFSKKVTLRTPLTLPIFIYWLVGGIATLHGVLLIFPTMSNVFPNVALLSFLRRIEYISLFFVAYAGMRNKAYVSYLSIALAIVLLLVTFYGFGQKFFGFPAYLTMNEEFAKGVPIHLSSLSRIPSTFAGQYDLAAYLVLIIPILVCMGFGFRDIWLKGLLFVSAFFGFVLLLMTVSRVSFFVLIMSLMLVLIIQKRKRALIGLLIPALLLLLLSPSLVKRFGNTVSEIDVLVDATTGSPIGQARVVPSSYFENKILLRQFSSAKDIQTASSSAIFPFFMVPKQAILIIPPNDSNGESLPQGTSYINLPLSPIVGKVGQYFYQASQQGTNSTEIHVFEGDYVIKRAKAYDLSFTTRFQGEWPRTLLAFERNIFFGSGYGSVSLAVDNDYLRLLGESGLFGFIAFFGIFYTAFLFIRKILPQVDSVQVRSFALGFIAGTFGLALNGIFIDVFEASKIAFVYWLLMGSLIGVLTLYQTESIDVLKELKKTITSSYAIGIGLFLLVFVSYFAASSFFFVGDDFTWFRWIIDCKDCHPLSTLLGYFTNANGFFYRPGTLLFFFTMHKLFWLNQTMYHLASLILDFIASILIFFIAKRVFRNKLLSFATSVFFLTLSGPSEAILWTAAIGYLFNAVFVFLSLLLFIFFRERQKVIYLISSLVFLIGSMLFHELGVVSPLLLILFDTLFDKEFNEPIIVKRTYYVLLFAPIIPYLLIRFLSHSLWFSGDYSYNIVKLPFNIVGNSIGYLGILLLGPQSFQFYEKARMFAKDHTIILLIGTLFIVGVSYLCYRLIAKALGSEEKKLLTFGGLFFLIALLPFLGLGNITSRYSYLPAFGFIVAFLVILRKFYQNLLSNGKPIATACMSLIIIIFVSTQLFQLQKVESDWQDAGEKIKTFLTSLDFIYSHDQREQFNKLYFVDVPIRDGDAWVFPVGLSDIIWLVFRESTIRVYQMSSAKAAFDALGNAPDGKVFQFDTSGEVIELRKGRDGVIYQVKT